MAWFGGGGGFGNMMGGLGDRLMAGGRAMGGGQGMPAGNPYTQGTGGAYGGGGGGGFMGGGMGGGGDNYGVPGNYWQGRMPTREGFQQLRTGMGTPMQRGGFQQAPGNAPMPYGNGQQPMPILRPQGGGVGMPLGRRYEQY